MTHCLVNQNMNKSSDVNILRVSDCFYWHFKLTVTTAIKAKLNNNQSLISPIYKIEFYYFQVKQGKDLHSFKKHELVKLFKVCATFKNPNSSDQISYL